MALGWGIEDETLTGLSRMLSAYTGTSDTGIFVIAITGMIAVPPLCHVFHVSRCSDQYHRRSGSDFCFGIGAACFRFILDSDLKA